MKRFLLSSLTLTFCIFTIVAQNCNPDVTITKPGVYPDQPDTAFTDQSYEFVFQILALKDTIVTFAGQKTSATIDSVKISRIMGLPSGFSYTCEPDRCTFTNSAVGCIKLTGNPTESQAGIYELNILSIAYATIGLLKLPVPDTISGYKLIVKGDGPLSISQPKETLFKIFPNPSSTGIYWLDLRSDVTDIIITDVQGKQINYTSEEINNITKIDISNSASGIYFMSISSQGRTYTKKIIH